MAMYSDDLIVKRGERNLRRLQEVYGVSVEEAEVTPNHANK